MKNQFVVSTHIYFIVGNIGVPIKLLYEAEGMKVTAEMKNGEIYRGLLVSAEDTMNMTLSDVLRTAKNGQITKLPNVYLRGSSVRFIALPELLKNAPVFQKVTSMKRKMEQEYKIKQQQGKELEGV
jgi:small nuclear ribonucleoprotein D3